VEAKNVHAFDANPESEREEEELFVNDFLKRYFALLFVIGGGRWMATGRQMK
jgi:hypothetical protein